MFSRSVTFQGLFPVVLLLACAAGPVHASSDSDEALLSQIESALIAAGLPMFDVEIEVTGGRAMLRGLVEDRTTRFGIERLVREAAVLSSRLEVRNAKETTERRHTARRLDVVSRCGDVRVAVRSVEEFQITATGQGYVAADDSVLIQETTSRTSVTCASRKDQQPIHIEVVAPYRTQVRVITTTGRVEYVGFGHAALQTASGDISLTCPWEATRFDLHSTNPAQQFEAAQHLATQTEQRSRWSAVDRTPDWREAWGYIHLTSLRPGKIQLHDMASVPTQSPIKMHWQAADLLPRLFRFGLSSLKVRDSTPRPPARAASEAMFVADVRLVDLNLSVTGDDGRPVPGLRLQDFEVRENGTPQQLSGISAGEAPFNLILLLDCSSSTEANRPAIEEAARRFVDVARPQDRVAIYALAESAFQVLSPLTGDHDRARSAIEGLARFGGGTPLYDSVILAFAEALPKHRGERNALVVLTDGLDNRFSEESPVPSAISFAQLTKAVREVDALLYPIVLDRLNAPARADPRQLDLRVKRRALALAQAKALAKSSGGKAFSARSLKHLDPVYSQVAQALGSVYSLRYYPLSQKFDGNWRSIRVKPTRPDVRVRTRGGYYALPDGDRVSTSAPR